MLEQIKSFIFQRQTAYRRALGGEPGKEVLADLMRFCRAQETVYNPDQRLTDVAIGRHEVWLRIQDHLKLSPDELFAISTSGQPAQRVQHEVDDDDDIFTG